MSMSLKDFIHGLRKGDSSGCTWKGDCDDINFIFNEKQLSQLRSGQANDLLMHQYTVLRMLVEQDQAEEIPNGVLVPAEVVVHLDENSRALLGLPPVWSGRIHTNIRGQTGKSSFKVELAAENEGKKFTVRDGFPVEGAIIRFSEEKQYLLNPAHLLIFAAVRKHESSQHTEYDNLSLVFALQQAQKDGASISLGHFDALNIRAPESVTIVAELDENGCLILTPHVGQEASHERVQKVLGQLSHEMATSLRVDDEIILFDEKRLEAVHEVLRNRVIPKDKVDAFLKNPTAFIDASLVDLDLGFSARVKGATRFRHAYFGETDESKIDWFGKKFLPAQIFPPKKLAAHIVDKGQLEEFRDEFDKARKLGAQEVEFYEKIYDISDTDCVNQVLSKIEEKLSRGDVSDVKDGDSSGSSEPAVVDIQLNDDDLETPSPLLDRQIHDVLLDENALDWSNYSRKPLLHQVFGVRWILGLALDSEGLGGGLLADDMGLGKTFMSLASMDHIYKACQSKGATEKPCLVVAPLGLLQNWADEVSQTFGVSPFGDIVILQAGGRLKDFRVGGVETKNQDLNGDEETKIRYSLKVGSSFANERLDLPRRLVITTYQTLRDYQFSLCSVDWGMVVFDEAQFIKNPNTLQTRAAKGIKADFRLLATGTPVENSLADFWCLMDTACPGYLGSYQEFRYKYIAPILQAASDEIEQVRGNIGRQLRERVGALMLRRVKEDNLDGLPNKRVFVGMDDPACKYLPSLHSVLKEAQLESYDSILDRVSSADKNVALAALQKLRDVSLHPRLVFETLDAAGEHREIDRLMCESGKLQSLLSVLNSIKSRREKCIIFAINKKLQAFLSVALAKFYGLPPIAVINGDVKAVAKRVSSNTRKSMIDAFEAREGFNIIVMSPIAAGVGLTIVGANNVIHLERHWNPAKEAQATDRVYRIGQKLDVNVFIPIAHHPKLQSFDVNLHQLLTKKSLLKDAVVTPEQVLPLRDGLTHSDWSPSQRINFDDVAKLHWEQFEALCAELLVRDRQPENCWLTSSGGDYGADVVLTKGKGAVLVQCKHTKGGLYDGYKAVTDVYSAGRKYENELGKQTETFIFATNAVRLGGRTRKLAKEYEVEILDGKSIAKLLQMHSVTYLDINSRLEKPRISV